MINGLMKISEISEGKNPNYIVQSEWNSVNNKKIDAFFIPINKENTIIIHEYKKSDLKNKDQILKNAILQIFRNRY